MTAVELPAEFDGWVEGRPPLRGNWVSVEVRTGGIGSNTRVVTRKYFVQPKPKPVLPDVKPGAVIRYADHDKETVRAVRVGPDAWDVYANVIDGSINRYRFNDQELFDDVSADGLTVILGGLEE
jgi:hypothetical protein